MRSIARRAAPLCLLALCACAQDYGVEAAADGLRAEPALGLWPARLDLPAVQSGGRSQGELLLKNEGTSAVQGLDLRWGGDPAFALLDVDLDDLSLEPGAELRLSVEGRPADDGALGWLRLGHGAVQVQAELAVDGLLPSLRMEPSPLTLGTAADGCALQGELIIENDGELPIQIEQLQAVGEGFSVIDGPTGPLAPGEAQPVRVAFTGPAPGDWSGALWLRTDRLGERSAALFARQAPPTVLTERMVQDGPWPAVDLILVADRSGSMAEDLSAIGAEAERLFEALAARSPGALISVVTQDDGCLSAGPLSPTEPRSRAALADGLLGPWGRRTEAGMSLGLAALQADAPGRCNAGLLREEARPVMVFISDEAEQSPEGWEDRLDALLHEAPDLQILAVVGPAGGCATARAGEGYLDAVGATGGQAWSICGDDWAALAAELGARAAGAGADRWTLSAPARPEGLEVTLDGRPWFDWRFDAESNAILFDPAAPPPPGATLEATFERAEACDAPAVAG